MSMNCVDPEQCLMGASVNETAVTENNTSNIGFNFTDVKAPLEINYKDAGAINLTAEATLPNGKTLRGTSEAFVWRPASIDVEASQDTSSNYYGTILAKAGEIFTAQLIAINDEGDVTPNFGNEAAPETLQLMAQTEAVESYNGEITNADGFTKDGAGVFTNSGLTYTEVGSTRVTAYIESQNYLPGYHGSPVMLTAESEIGRFIPYEFQLETFGGFSGVCNRGNESQGEEFYYIGEPQLLGAGFTLTAVNKNGETTKNYPTDIVEGELEFSPFNEVNGNSEPLNRSQLFATDVELEWGQDQDSAGTATFKLPTPSVTYRRDGAEEGPYEDYKLGIQFNDSEGGNYYSIITESNLPAAAQAPAFKLYDSVKLLYGRFVLDNIFGAEVDDLPLSGRAQFWNGDSFVKNTNDNCFTVSVSKLDVLSAIDPTTEPVTSLDTESIEPSDTPDSVSLAEGELQEEYSPMEDLLRWQAYGSNAEFTFEFDLSDDFKYLQYDWNGDSNYQDNPTAEGTFGIYRGRDRQIYWREVGW
jgi:MSHA biogenesis protein MshQ